MLIEVLACPRLDIGVPDMRHTNALALKLTLNLVPGS
jgi:hypothetical protein